MTFRSCAERGKKPKRGKIRRCRRCGQLVVHSLRTGKPVAVHWRSTKCRRKLAKSADGSPEIAPKALTNDV